MLFRALFLCCVQTIFATPILIGIAGGTGSGKTTLAEKIHEAFPTQSTLISQDSYYKDIINALPLEEQKKYNFDHPDALDFAMLKDHLIALKNNQSIQQPIWNFHIHGRDAQTNTIQSAPLIIVEGILIFADAGVRDLLDVKIFVDTDDDIRILRRIERDILERGRELTGIKNQYISTVKPMHNAFVEPSKKYADIIVPEGGYNSIALDLILAKLKNDLISHQEK